MVELSRQNRKAGTLFAMNKITQTARYRQSLILYAQKHGVTEAAKRYRTYRQCIQHKCIKPFTPRHNGKVERSHRKDNEYFYADHKFFSFDDFQKQLAVWNRKYNDFPMRPLGWLSPKQALSSFPNVVTHH